jgi:Fe-S cluster assembly ATP-binding protein
VTQLVVSGLHAGVAGREILRGIDLTVSSGEVHAVMGPNGSGKSTLSHVIMGRPGYQVTAGSVAVDGTELLGLDTWQRAQAGLFLAMQYPTEVPGVPLEELLVTAVAARGGDTTDLPGRLAGEAAALGVEPRFLDRFVNVDLSGGEKKRNETLQMSVLRPAIAILDEIDSGLDVDALRAVARRVERETHERGLGVLAITHYSRLLTELRPDVIHVLSQGRIVATGGPELAEELERTGYAQYAGEDAADDPFADPLA